MPVPSRLPPARAVLLAACLAAALGACQALGGGGGVMPATDVGLPPSLRSGAPNRGGVAANVDAEGQPLQTAPTRRLDLPKNTRGGGTSTAGNERRIQREDIEGSAEGSRSSGGIGAALTPGGSVGLGGKF